MGNANSGRRPGAQNKLAREARDRVMEVFELIGGTAAFAVWAKANPTEFYLGMFKQLIPKQLNASVESSTPLITLNAVHVDNPETALTVLEILERNRHTIECGDQASITDALPADARADTGDVQRGLGDDGDGDDDVLYR